MIDVACYLCGSKDALTLFTQTFVDPYLSLVDPLLNTTPRHWKICNACGFIYRTPMLTPAEQEILYKNYGDDVFKNESPEAYFDRIAALPPLESENHAKAIWLKKYLAKPNGTLSVLDVGCGAGLLMHTLREVLAVPMSLHGVELNSDYADLAICKLKADVRQTDYRPGLFGKKFSFVMCTKVLEHVRDPLDFVGKLAADLTDDGQLFIEVPDVLDIENLPAEHDRFFIPHIYFFSPNTMAEILGRSGLGVVASRSITTHRGRSYLQVIAAKNHPVAKPSKPYDDAKVLLAKRRAKFVN